MVDEVITADPIIVTAGIDPAGIVRVPEGKRMKDQMRWRDHAGNIWHTTLYVDGAGAETSQLDLIQPVNPAALPTEPVPAPVVPHAPEVTSKLALPADIGLKTKLNEKGESSIKVSQVYWRDAANNIWFAEEFKASSGESFTHNTLIAAAVQGVPPAVPVEAS